MPRDKDTVLDVESGKVEPTGLPASDVLYYELEGGAWVCVRPSGTEPKMLLRQKVLNLLSGLRLRHKF